VALTDLLPLTCEAHVDFTPPHWKQKKPFPPIEPGEGGAVAAPDPVRPELCEHRLQGANRRRRGIAIIGDGAAQMGHERGGMTGYQVVVARREGLPIAPGGDDRVFILRRTDRKFCNSADVN
jgi:hypothetical protein